MDPERTGDELLLARFLDGDESSFETLVRRHEDRIFALTTRMMGDRADALEAAQDTFIRLFGAASSFRGDSAFSTWLYRIGINVCRDMLRKRSRLPIPTEELVEPDPSRDLEEQSVARMDLASALAALPDDYREAVCLHDLGGVPYEDIAQATGVAVGTVKSRISRGRRKLAALLEQGTAPGSSKSRGAHQDDDMRSTT